MYDDKEDLTDTWVDVTQITMQCYMSQFLFQSIDGEVKYKIRLFLSTLGCALPYPEKRYYGLSFNHGSINVDILDSAVWDRYETYISVATHYDSKSVRWFMDAYPEYAEYVKDYNTQRYGLRLFASTGGVR